MENVVAPELDAEDVATELERYVEAIALLGGTMSETISRSPEQFIHRWPTACAREWLASFLAQALGNGNVIAVVAIGSAVRSKVTSDDLDLFVVCRDRKRLTDRAPIEIDPRSADITHVDQDIRAGHDLVVWAVRYGQPLLDRDGTWQRIVDDWKDRLPLPDPSISMERAKCAQRRMKELEDIGDDEAVSELRISYLTHRSWACLARAGVPPQSRPELPQQLRTIGEANLAAELEDALTRRIDCTVQ